MTKRKPINEKPQQLSPFYMMGVLSNFEKKLKTINEVYGGITEEDINKVIDSVKEDFKNSALAVLLSGLLLGKDTTGHYEGKYK